MKLTVPAIALASVAFAAQAFAQSGPEQKEGAAPFQHGLAQQMREAAQHLKHGARYDAMTALNGARHLAKATTSAPSMSPDAMRAFRAAEASVNAARAEVQNGRPEQAPETLEDAADALEQASVPAPSPPDRAMLAKASGRIALDDSGQRIGTVRTVSPGVNGGFQVRILSGGLFGIGATERSVEAPALLIGKPYVLVTGK